MGDLLGLPLDASVNGSQIDHIIILVHILMAVLFVGWGSYFLYVLFRFRSSRNRTADYVGVKSHASSYIEGIVAVIELVLLIGFAIPLWAMRVNDIPPDHEATVVRVVGEQFAWNVHYPGPDGTFGKTDISLVSSENPLGLDRSDPAAKDDITTINQLTLPVGRPVVVRLSSKDVIHSFGIPYMRVKQDAIPGQTVRVTFTPTRTSDQILGEMTRTFTIDRQTNAEKFSVFVAMAEYKDKDGVLVLGKGDPISQDAIGKLLDAGINQVIAGPYSPIEVACSQLCGLGHFRMRATVTILSPDAYQAWLADQAAALAQ
jgi:cytochrome c oxidase subunit 2